MHMLLLHATICVSVEQLEWISLAAILVVSRRSPNLKFYTEIRLYVYQKAEHTPFHREARDQYLKCKRLL
eukprot:scaffold2987_cov77-Skeletonema_dohrnii-CCMP3373.AAC.2